MKNILSNISCLLFGLSLCFYANAQQITFEDIADEIGITHTIITSVFGGGVSFSDFDGDGLEDISFTTEIGQPISIYKNENILFTDVAAQLGLDDSSSARTLLWADYDNDGDQDLFLANFGQQNRLFRNEGNDIFIDVTQQSGMPLENSPSTAAVWADFNNDGHIDLYVGNYGAGNNSFPNYLLKNGGHGTFTEIAIDSGALDTIGGTNKYKLPLAISCFDFNNDGLVDIYIANDKKQGNTLFKNIGGLEFIDVSQSSNAGLQFDAMGIAVGDYNNDGYLDVYVSNLPQGNGLLRNNGDETFTNVASELGLLVNRICWGVNFLDYDNDSDLDLFVSVSGGTGLERKNALFENMGDGTFSEYSGSEITEDLSRSYGNAIGDYNNDGYCDIVVLNRYPTYSNVWKNSGYTNNWVKIKLIGVISNRNGIGSTLKIFIESESFIRPVICGGSYLSQNSSIQTIGVGTAIVIDSIIISWPNGAIDVIRNVAVNQTIVVEEGEPVTKVEEENSLHKNFVLEQNYPNPFNPSTIIKYSLSQATFVTIKIYDISGRELKTLINKYQQVGNYEVQFIDKSLSSSMYIYRMQAGEFTDTKKLLLLK